MTQVISIDTNTAKNILDTLIELKREVARLRERLDEEPVYGSNEWWEWSDRKALDDIKKGNYTTIHNKKEMQTFLDSLKTT